MVYLQDGPHLSRQCYLLSHRRRLDDGAQLAGLASHRILLILLEHRVEAEGIGHPLSREADDKASPLGAGYLVCFYQVPEKDPVVILTDLPERSEVQHL